MIESKILIEQNEKVFVYSGIAVINTIIFFCLISIFNNTLTKNSLIPLGLILLIIAGILFNNAIKEYKTLEKIKEVEILRELNKEIKTKK